MKKGGKTEKHIVIFRNVKNCEFSETETHIIATTQFGSSFFCAFFDKGLHTEESIRRRGSIKLHSIYPKA